MGNTNDSSDDAIRLPTVREALSEWLGVQLPTFQLPQTAKNLDKAIGTVVLAIGENLEARIKGHTATTKVKDAFKVDDLIRTEEEKRKLKNRAAVTKAAIEDLQTGQPTEDAPSEIDDDWLNLFVRLSEDKSSEELQSLFGKILSGEVRRPGSFSLRTIHLMSTISKQEAERISELLAYSINKEIIPFENDEHEKPTAVDRVFLQGIGLAGHASVIGGMQATYKIEPQCKHLIISSRRGILVENISDKSIEIKISGQILTIPAQELIRIADPPTTSFEYLKAISKSIGRQHPEETRNGSLRIHVVNATSIDDNKNFSCDVIWTLKQDDALNA